MIGAEEGAYADDAGKFQSFAITIVPVVANVAMAIHRSPTRRSRPT
jgi:hypothetical protein